VEKKAPKSHKTWEGNLGIGYRWLTQQETIIGLATYFDHRKTNVNNEGFNQITQNFHFLTPIFHNNLNLYLPIGKKTHSKKNNQVFTGNAKAYGINTSFIYSQNFIQERALPGVDFRFSSAVGQNDKFRLGALVYGFKNKRSNPDIIGGGITAEYALNDNFKLESKITYDKTNKTSFLAGVRYTLDFNKNKKSSVEKLFLTSVDRDVDIITHSKNQSRIIEQEQPNIKTINPNTLNNIDDPNNLAKNLADLASLSEATRDPNTIFVLSDGGDTFNYEQAHKIHAVKIRENEQHLINSNLSKLQHQSVANINNANTNLSPLERVIATIATQKAYQQRNNTNAFMVAGHVIDGNYAKRLSQLFNKYARETSSPNKEFTVNLPGYNTPQTIKRAGVIIVDKNNQVILGKDVNYTWSSWFSGSCENRDAAFQDTIIREAFEESAGIIALEQTDIDTAISKGHFFYNPEDKILTVIYKDNNLITENLNLNLTSIKADRSLPAAMKEMEIYRNVPILDVSTLAGRMKNNPPLNPHDSSYFINDIRIERHYARSLGFGGIEALEKVLIP
jgi:hypothetical protein